MNKIIAVFDGFESEDHARLYGEWLRQTHGDYIAKVYVVQAESEDR